MVTRFVVGDDVPSSFHSSGSEARMTASRIRVVGTDLVRLLYRSRSRLRLWRKLRGAQKRPALAYERYALMQELGRVAQRQGSTWVLEVNALLAMESTSDRRATSSRRVATFFEKRTLRRADLIVAVTENLKSAISATYGISSERIIVVENGVNARAHGSASAAQHARPTIGFLGTLYSWQRVDELFRAVQRSETPWLVRIAGEGPEYGALQALALDLGIDDRVSFLGRVHPDQVPDFLSTVDICYAGHGSSAGVYFSPLKLWEYLAAGRPVIASSHDTTNRLRESGYAVRVFGHGDGELDFALRSAVEELPALLTRAVDDQERVASDHSWSARISPLLERVAAMRSRR